MANNNTLHTQGVIGFNSVTVEGSFYSNSGSAPTDVRGLGFSVASGTMTNIASGSTLAITQAQHYIQFDDSYNQLQYFDVRVGEISGTSQFYANNGPYFGSTGSIFQDVSGAFPNSIVVTTYNQGGSTAATCKGRIHFKAVFRNGSSE
jgi:hypothetical protein